MIEKFLIATDSYGRCEGMRITNSILINNMIRSITKNASRMSIYQQQLATGKKISVPSDDPIVAARALKLRTDVAEIEQFEKNAQDAKSWLDLTDLALTNFGDVIKRVRDLNLEGAGGVMTQNEKNKIFNEINELKQQLIEIGNSTYAGRYLFAGFETDSPPITVETMQMPTGEYIDRIKYNGRYLNLGGAMKLGSDTAKLTGAVLGFPVNITAGTTNFKVKLDNVEHEIVLDTGTYSDSELAAQIQSKINSAFGEHNIKVSVDGLNHLVLETVREQNIELAAGTSNDALATLGHVPASDTPATLASTLNVFNDNYYLIDGKPILKGGNVAGGFPLTITAGDNNQFSLKLGSDTATITVTPGIYNNVTELSNEIQARFDAAPPAGFGTGRIKVDVNAYNNRVNFISLNNETITINEVAGNKGIVTFGFRDGLASVANQKNPIKYQIGIANSVNINIEGNEILGGISKLFDVFNKIEMALKGERYYRELNDDGTTQIKELRLTDLVGEIDTAHENILGMRADVGARYNYVELAINRLTNEHTGFTKLMSENEDIDMAEVIMNLKNEENVYSASLAAGARVIMPSLVDFLR